MLAGTLLLVLGSPPGCQRRCLGEGSQQGKPTHQQSVGSQQAGLPWPPMRQKVNVTMLLTLQDKVIVSLDTAKHMAQLSAAPWLHQSCFPAACLFGTHSKPSATDGRWPPPGGSSGGKATLEMLETGVHRLRTLRAVTAALSLASELSSDRVRAGLMGPRIGTCHTNMYAWLCCW